MVQQVKVLLARHSSLRRSWTMQVNPMIDKAFSSSDPLSLLVVSSPVFPSFFPHIPSFLLLMNVFQGISVCMVGHKFSTGASADTCRVLWTSICVNVATVGTLDHESKCFLESLKLFSWGASLLCWTQHPQVLFYSICQNFLLLLKIERIL